MALRVCPHVAWPSLVVSHAPPSRRAPRFAAVRADRLTELESHVVNVMRSSMRMSTEAVLDRVDADWLARYAGLFDAVNLPFSHPRDWERLCADARAARVHGLEVHVRTLVTPSAALLDVSSRMEALGPEAWTLSPSASLSAGEFQRFMMVNAPAMESIPAVSVLWDSGRTRFPRRGRRARGRSSLLD